MDGWDEGKIRHSLACEARAWLGLARRKKGIVAAANERVRAQIS